MLRYHAIIITVSYIIRHQTTQQEITRQSITDHTLPTLCTAITPGSDGMVRSAAAWRYLQLMCSLSYLQQQVMQCCPGMFTSTCPDVN